MVICAAGAVLLSNPSANGKNIGIIGGADGPTRVYITSNDKTDSSPYSALSRQDLEALGDVVVFYEGGAIKRIALIDTDETRYFIDTVIFDHMIRSAAWPALDMKDYPDRVDIYRTGSEAAQGLDFSVFHVFVKDGAPFLQMDYNMYSGMSPELYEQLQLFGTPSSGDRAPLAQPLCAHARPLPRRDQRGSRGRRRDARPHACRLVGRAGYTDARACTLVRFRSSNRPRRRSSGGKYAHPHARRRSGGRNNAGTHACELIQC